VSLNLTERDEFRQDDERENQDQRSRSGGAPRPSRLGWHGRIRNLKRSQGREANGRYTKRQKDRTSQEDGAEKQAIKSRNGEKEKAGWILCAGCMRMGGRGEKTNLREMMALEIPAEKLNLIGTSRNKKKWMGGGLGKNREQPRNNGLRGRL